MAPEINVIAVRMALYEVGQAVMMHKQARAEYAAGETHDADESVWRASLHANRAFGHLEQALIAYDSAHDAHAMAAE